MSWSLRRRRRAQPADGGAVAVEAAVIFPVVLLLGLGIIEWSLVLQSQIELTTLARAGARAASSLAPDAVDPHSHVSLPDQVVESMKQAASTLPEDSLQYALVYVPGSHGLKGDPRTTNFHCGHSSQCAKYYWDAGAKKFVPGGESWDGSSINACLGDDDMTDVGVYLRASHDMLTGIFGSGKGLSAYTVMRVDPQQPGQCG